MLYYFLRFRFFKLPLIQFHKKIFRGVLKGLSVALLEEQIAFFVEENLKKILYKPAFYKLKEAKRLGHYTILISSSPNFLVKKIAEYLGMDAWFASKYVANRYGKLFRIEKVLLGEDKKRILKLLLKKFKLSALKSTAYSDSILDLPLLLFVGKAVAVRPDEKLLRVSKKYNWDII